MPQSTQINPIAYLLLWGPILLIFYFIVLRPQKLEQKRHREMLKGLNKNDEVVTSSGIHGTIVNVKDKTVILRIDDNVKIEIEKHCIAYLKKPQETV